MPVASAGTAARPIPSRSSSRRRSVPPASSPSAQTSSTRDAAAGEPDRQVGALPSKADANLRGHVRTGA